ncbi:collagen alpha-1(X) chain-like [Saccostrea cucullata]|uniref:collagen alpha-1(X) chain-like n=1 Tax=Saccostrea cuccullata TaxID=36930 RepID=UPI002ED1F947
MFLLLNVVVMILILNKETDANSSSDFVTSYKKYHEICIGMGYQDQGCKRRERGPPAAFHALMSKQLTSLATNVPVAFGKITLNEGNAYDPSSGKFTAPTDGIYYFTWTVLTGKGKLFNTEIVLNNKIVGYTTMPMEVKMASMKPDPLPL